MTVVNVHLSQIKQYQNQVEERLAICDKESSKMMSLLGIKREARKIRHIKQKLFKKKLHSMVSAMKCKHARSKQDAHVAKKQVGKLVSAIKKIVAAKKAGEKAANEAL